MRIQKVRSVRRTQDYEQQRYYQKKAAVEVLVDMCGVHVSSSARCH